MMKPETERFLRDAHILARLVEQILEDGYLRQSSGDRITFAQLNIMKFLARPGRKVIRDVMRFLQSTHPAASMAVGRLKKKNLVRTVSSKTDGRSEVVELTDKGRSLISRYERTKQGRMEALLGGQGDVELACRGLEAAIGLLMKERSVAGNPCMECGVYYSKQCVSRLFGAQCPYDEGPGRPAPSSGKGA